MWNLYLLTKLLLTTQLVSILPRPSLSERRQHRQSSSLLLADAFSLGNPNILNVHLKKSIMALNHRRNANANALLGIPRGGGRDSSSGFGSRNTELRMVPPSDIIATTFDNAPMFQSFLIFGGANLLGYVISLLTGSHLHLDLLGTGAFALASLPTLMSSSVAAMPRVATSSAAVVIWGTKLASFLFYRALQVKHDARLDAVLSTVSGTTGFWVTSLLWGIVCSLPHTLGTTSSKPGSPVTLAVGTAVYSLGLVTESLADYQKWQFKKGNPGQFCDAGLWGVSQHPNFFGNLLLWFGIFIMNADSLIAIAQSNADAEGAVGVAGVLSALWESRRVAFALLSPLFMWTLFSGQATGSIGNAVEAANARYGQDPAYQSYIEDVPLIIPDLFAWLKKLLPF